MKFISKLLIGIIATLALITTVFASSDNIAKTTPEPKKMDRPYIVDVLDKTGNETGEFRGVSSETDPFLISKELGAQPFAEDRFSSFPDMNMGIGSKITLNRAPDYVIKDGKKEKTVRSWVTTVEELLNENKIEIGQDDKVNFANDTELEDGMKVVITRVAITTVVEHEPIAYNVVKKSNPNYEKDYKKILTSGVNGIRDKYYLVRREDGEEVSRKFIKNETAQAPVDEILEVGTKVVVYGSGEASWYIKTGDMIGACNIVPRGTKLHVVNLANGKSIDITSSGGGIGISGRIVDLSTGAFQALGASLGQGTIKNVRVEKYYPPE